MKSRVLFWLGIAVVASLVSARPASAQLNCFSFSSDLAEYDSESTDGTTIYTTVAVDGSQEMNAWGQCQQFVGYAVHTPYVINQLSTPEQTVGGGEYGDGVCASCYISAGNEQEITPLPSEQVEFETETMAGCSFGGNFFDSGSNYMTIRLTSTTYRYQSVANGVCTYRQFCGATTATCGSDNFTKVVPCAATYYTVTFLYVRGGVLNNSWAECVPVAPASSSTIPFPCD